MLKKLKYILPIIMLSACGDSESNESEETTFQNVEHVQHVSEASDQLEKKPAQPYPFRYYVKDGKITYTYAGDQKGTETVYFADYGMTEVKYTETQRVKPFSGEIEHISMITLMRDSFIYVVDKSTMNAQRLNNTVLYQLAEQQNNLDLNQVAESMYKQVGGFNAGVDPVAGVPAEKWEIPSKRQMEWRWKGIMAKTLMENDRSYIKIAATEIDTSVSFSDSVFQLPKHLNIVDGTPLNEWLEDLSKPLPNRQVFDREGNMVNKPQ